jgi:hypothetical protein
MQRHVGNCEEEGTFPLVKIQGARLQYFCVYLLAHTLLLRQNDDDSNHYRRTARVDAYTIRSTGSVTTSDETSRNHGERG